MKGRYAALMGGVIVLALCLAVLARAPRARVASKEEVAPAVPAARVTIAIEGRTIVPETITVAKGERVTVRVTNRSSFPAKLALLGYSDVFPETAIAPGATLERAFLADRPGSDFAWLLNQAPVGTFVVAGSHLVEGHR